MIEYNLAVRRASSHKTIGGERLIRRSFLCHEHLCPFKLCPYTFYETNLVFVVQTILRDIIFLFVMQYLSLRALRDKHSVTKFSSFIILHNKISLYATIFVSLPKLFYAVVYIITGIQSLLQYVDLGLYMVRTYYNMGLFETLGIHFMVSQTHTIVSWSKHTHNKLTTYY